MPEISRFFRIIIRMYYREGTRHHEPHFHAEHQEFEAVFSITDLRILEGNLPRRAKKLVTEWATEHRAELKKNWELARQKQALNKIKPLE